MARMAAARAQYAKNMVTTSPERLVTMLYDRLIRDLVAAEQAIGDGDIESTNREIQHAQEILIELRSALDVKAWTHANELAALYTFLIRQLLLANVRKNADLVRECRDLVEPIAEAWHQAAGRVAAQAHAGEPVARGTLGAAV